jgi:hypothetical protein
MNPETMALLPIYDTDITYVGNSPIHPTNKTPVGKRFATAALNMVYGGGGEYTAPVFDSMTVSGDTIIVKFSHVGDGLKSANNMDDIRGFAICDEDNVFAGAKARIISANEVKVWNERVKNPKQVTYAWASFNIASNLANSVGIAAAPFRSDRKDGYQYYNPQDWTFADELIWGVDASEFVGFIPAWTNAPVSGITDVTLGYDPEYKSEGKASLKVEYSAAGIVGVGPVLTHKTTVTQLANFNTLSVDVLNPDERGKSVELLLKASDGKIYKAMFVGYEGSSTQETAVTIGKTSGFRTLAFDLKTLKNEQDVIVPANYTANILPTVTAIQVTVTDNAAGTIYLDNAAFGFSTEKTALSVGKEVAGGLQFDVRLLNNTLSVKSGADNPLRKIELIDMQGRTAYSKNNINSAEYSFEILAGRGLYMAKIQSDKLTSSEKILVD